MTLRITCVDKVSGNQLDPHEAISYFGWVTDAGTKGGYTLAQMVIYLEDGGVAYTQDANGRAKLEVRSRNGHKYVKTVADGRDTDNLLHLDKCSR